MSLFFRHQLVLIALLMVSVWLGAQQQPAPAQPQQPKIAWQDGPVTGKLGDVAEIKIPEGYSFADKHGTQTLLEMTHNIPNGRELGALIPNVSKA